MTPKERRQARWNRIWVWLLSPAIFGFGVFNLLTGDRVIGLVQVGVAALNFGLSMADQRELQQFAVARALIARVGQNTSLSEICQAAGLGTGTIYRLLIRWQDNGWVETEWEPGDFLPAAPRRRLYRLTPAGQARIRATYSVRETRFHVGGDVS